MTIIGNRRAEKVEPGLRTGWLNGRTEKTRPEAAIHPRQRQGLTFLLFLLPVLATAAVPWSAALKQPTAWYGGEEARALATSVVGYQQPAGGWPKNLDFTRPLATAKPDPKELAATIDNGATTTPLTFLARIITARADADLTAAFNRGFDYLLAAQYPSGGWPQFFPLKQGYYTHITYNDNATANVLAVLRGAATGTAPFAFVDAPRRERAVAAVAKAIECILRTQVRQRGELTVWCAQHDETTFAPAWARNFEPPSLSASESVGLVKFLMSLEKPTPEIIAAIEGAMRWFERSRILGLRVDESPGTDGKADRRAVADPKAPSLWARFYELETNRPIYTGRDRVIRYDFNEIERERRTGYGYLGDWPAGLLAKDYPRWRTKHHRP